MAPSIFTFLPPCSCSVCFHIKLGVTHFFHQFLLQQIQKAGRFFLLSTNPIFSKICVRHLLTLFCAFLIYLLIFSPTRLVILYYVNELKDSNVSYSYVSYHIIIIIVCYSCISFLMSNNAFDIISTMFAHCLYSNPFHVMAY